MQVGAHAHLPIFLDEEEEDEKVLVCTVVLPLPSAKMGKGSEVRSESGHQEIEETVQRDGDNHRQRRKSDGADEDIERVVEEEPEETSR